jgi:hypothetical protein
MSTPSEVVLTYCPDPDCYAPAEVVDVYDLDSTAGPVTHTVTVCVRRHRYVTTE